MYLKKLVYYMLVNFERNYLNLDLIMAMTQYNGNELNILITKRIVFKSLKLYCCPNEILHSKFFSFQKLRNI